MNRILNNMHNFQLKIDANVLKGHLDQWACRILVLWGKYIVIYSVKGGKPPGMDHIPAEHGEEEITKIIANGRVYRNAQKDLKKGHSHITSKKKKEIIANLKTKESSA